MTTSAALFGLAVFMSVGCGSPTAPQSSLGFDIVGTWQNRGCTAAQDDDEPLAPTCVTLDLEPSHRYTYTAHSDYPEFAHEGRWGVVAVDHTSGQLHLEHASVAPVVLRGAELELSGESMVKVASASGGLRPQPVIASFATLDAIVGQRWYRLGGPLAGPLAPSELDLGTDGTYSVAFDSGCEASGDLWGYREETSAQNFHTRSESVLTLMDGCANGTRDHRFVSVDRVDDLVFFARSAYGLQADPGTNHALGHDSDGVRVHATYSPPTDAGERTVVHLRVLNDRTDTIEVFSVDVNATSLVVDDEGDGYSTSSSTPDTTTSIEGTIASGGHGDFEIELVMPEGAGVIARASVRFVATGREMSASVDTRPIYATG